MSHRLCAVSSDYCSVCQNGPLPSAADTASNPLWPLAAPFPMTNCQPAPTKARLKCQHRMTKGPRGSSETNCVQYELILYSRAGAQLACSLFSGCWLASKPGEGAGLVATRWQGGRAPARVRPADMYVCDILEEVPERCLDHWIWSPLRGFLATVKGLPGRMLLSKLCLRCSSHPFRDQKEGDCGDDTQEGSRSSQRKGYAKNTVAITLDPRSQSLRMSS